MKKANNIEPFSIWDQMAETDILIEYLRRFVDSNINTSSDLYHSMMESLYSYSNEVIQEVELHYASKLYLTMKYFTDKVILCQNQKQ